jgi:hypothetical protein
MIKNTRHWQRWRKRRDLKQPQLVHKICREMQNDKDDYKGQTRAIKNINLIARLHPGHIFPVPSMPF